MQNIAIIGAGVAGSIAAHTLRSLGYSITMFDKSRGVGGRMATRRSTAGEFDHGARYFTAETNEFMQALSQAPVQLWQQADKHNKDRCFVATPRQNQLAKYWLDDIPTQLNCRIDQLRQTSAGWQLIGEQVQTSGHYDGVLLAIPAPQARDLLDNSGLGIPALLAPVNMDPVWALMISLEKPLPETAYTDPAPSISWLGANFSKPGRPHPTDSFAYVAHASCDWSRRHLEKEAADVAEMMLQTLAGYLAGFSAPIFASAHRWRFALTQTPMGRSHLALDNHLILAGDWCLGAEVEDAFTSGTQAALQMHENLCH